MKKVVFFLLLLIPFFTKAEELKSKILLEDSGIAQISDSFIGQDGKIYLSGYGSKGFVMILNSNYEVVKRKFFDDYDICMAVQIDEESNVYSLCKKRIVFQGFGITNSVNHIDYFELVKLDNNLNIIYQKSFREQYDQSIPYSMIIKNNQLYFVIGEQVYDSFSREDDNNVYLNYLSNVYLYKVNLDGELVKKTPLTTDQSVELAFVKQNGGGGSVFGRYFNILSLGDYLYICTSGLFSKVDYSGNKIWSIDLFETYGINGSKIAKTNDGKIILGGRLHRNNSLETIDSNYSPILATFDRDTGDLIDHKLFKGYGEIRTVENNDGGYYVSFNTRGAVEGINDARGIYFAKLDYNFNIKDVKNIEKSSFFYAGLAEKGTYSYERGSLVNYYSDFSKDITAEKTIKMNETISITKILEEDLTSLEWAIDDPSIISVKDGIITPKKIGSTYIRSTNENKDYSIKITVIDLDKEEKKEENNIDKKDNTIIKNPNTYDYIIILMIILITLILIISLSYKKLIKRPLK